MRVRSASSESRVSGLRDALLVTDRSALPSVGASPAYEAICLRLSKCGTAFRPEDGGEFRPTPLKSSSICCQRRRVCPKLSKKRVALGFDVLIWSSSSSSLSSSRVIADLRLSGSGRPSPVVSSSSRCGGRARWARSWRSLREQQTFDAVYMLDALCDQRLAFAAEASSVLLLRFGGTAMAQTRGSPRLNASRARRRASPSSLSVLALRLRRDVAIDAGSTTWLSTPSLLSRREPESIESGLLDGDDRERLPVLAWPCASVRRNAAAGRERRRLEQCAWTFSRRLQAKAT